MNFYDLKKISPMKIYRVILMPRGYGKIYAMIEMEKKTSTMTAIEIIEKHLKEAGEKHEAAYQKVMLDSSTQSDWNEYNKTLEACIALRSVYLDVIENEIKEAKKQL